MDCPEHIAKLLSDAGGLNPFGEAMFRVVWGNKRIVKMTGQWSASEPKPGVWDTANGPVETREVPKYLPGECWHLEMWRPPEEYGSPEEWGKAGREVIGFMTVDTAGPFPSRGEYELCYPITSDLSVHGKPLSLDTGVALLIAKSIRENGKIKMSATLRASAIRQRLERERKQRIREGADMLLDARPAFYDQPTSFGTGPKNHKINTGLWLPESYRN